MALALSRCSATLRSKLLLRYPALTLRGTPPMSQSPATVGPCSIRAHTALFHLSKAAAIPEPNKPTSVLSSGLEGELLGMGVWSLGLGAVGAAIVGIFFANTDLCLSKVAQASMDYLEDADLRSTTDDGRVIKARSLWETSGAVVVAVRRPGWFLCREEASELSSLKPELEQLGVPLVAVVKEDIGTELQDFRPHFAGDIYIDEKKHFYGPLQRKMGGLGFFRLGVWQNFMRARRSGHQGNMIGEGFILGGVFVIGPGDQGILLEHREKEFGDKVNNADVLEAVKKIIPAK